MADDLRKTLGGVQAPSMKSDNLAIFMASFFEEATDTQDENGWSETAIAQSDEVLDAIHAHYASELARLRTELEAAKGDEEPAHGWLYFNPDTGREWAQNHPVESGEAHDAEDVRPATLAACHAELLEAWEALAGERALRRAAPFPVKGEAGPSNNRDAAIVAEAEVDLIRASLRWAIWCDGRGVSAAAGQNVAAPGAFLVDYSDRTGDEDLTALPDRLAGGARIEIAGATPGADLRNSR